MFIGLKRGTVKLMAHNRTWHKEFKAEKTKLFKKLGKNVVDIQHIGSTSVKQIKAKPIIDIAIGTKKTPNLKFLKNLLKPLGYAFRKNASLKIKHLFFAKGSPAKTTHYLHIEKFGSQRWKNDLKFRDNLNSYKALSKEYEELKIKLVAKFPKNREAYTAGKNKFIKKVINYENRH